MTETAQHGGAGMDGAQMIASERERQKLSRAEGGEGWNADHDAGHADELALAAACYALPARRRKIEASIGRTISAIVHVQLWRSLWPWAEKWWKPTPGNRVRELVKAGALIAAAIDDELANSR